MPDSDITKKALAAAMKKLMAQKPFLKISVRDICEECGMSRKSFYYHFKDKYDLMNWIFAEDFVGRIDPGAYESEWGLLDDLCRYFYAEREFYCNALRVEGQNSFKEYFFETQRPLIASYVQHVFARNVKKDFYVAFFCDGFLSAIARWLQEGSGILPEEFIEDMHGILVLLARRVVETEK